MYRYVTTQYWIHLQVSSSIVNCMRCWKAVNKKKRRLGVVPNLESLAHRRGAKRVGLQFVHHRQLALTKPRRQGHLTKQRGWYECIPSAVS